MLRRNREAAVLLAALASALGCQRQIAPSPGVQASTPWVEIHREGGIAGMQTTLTLRSDGAFVIATRRGCGTASSCAATDSASGVVASDSLASLRRAADALPSASFASFGISRGWADQYIYDIALVRGDTTLHAQGDDGSLPPAVRDWNGRVFASVSAARGR